MHLVPGAFKELELGQLSYFLFRSEVDPILLPLPVGSLVEKGSGVVLGRVVGIGDDLVRVLVDHGAVERNRVLAHKCVHQILLLL